MNAQQKATGILSREFKKEKTHHEDWKTAALELATIILQLPAMDLPSTDSTEDTLEPCPTQQAGTNRPCVLDKDHGGCCRFEESARLPRATIYS